MVAAFEIDAFVAACRAAVAGTDAARAVRELVAEAVADAAAIAAAFGEPEQPGPRTIYRAADLTVLDFSWPPWMCFKPHNHNMWSVVGIYAGREDNLFWRRTPASDQGPASPDRAATPGALRRTIEVAGGRSLGTREVATLGEDIIHSVTNPIGKLTRAIHVYGGDFFAPLRERSEWDPETLVERAWDFDDTRRRFADAEARSRALGR